jgi:hypothetical protein
MNTRKPLHFRFCRCKAAKQGQASQHRERRMEEQASAGDFVRTESMLPDSKPESGDAMLFAAPKAYGRQSTIEVEQRRSTRH